MPDHQVAGQTAITGVQGIDQLLMRSEFPIIITTVMFELRAQTD